MFEKDLRKLNRKQLLELLLKQTERADELEKLLADAEQRLEDKTIAQKEAGTMADAALKLNAVFEAADAAAAQYLENVKLLSESSGNDLSEEERNAKANAEKMIRDTEEKCALREAKAEKKLKETYLKYKRLQKEIEELEKLKDKS